MKNSGCLCTVPLFAPLSLDEKNEIKCLLHHQTFKKGEIIFSPSSEEQLLIISLGAMKIYRISRTGKEQLIRIVKKGITTVRTISLVYPMTAYMVKLLKKPKLALSINPTLIK